jgi:hypothetical protein
MITVKGYADFSRTPGGFDRPTPEIGEHSAELLAEWGHARRSGSRPSGVGRRLRADGFGVVAAPVAAT